jgi:hypothetical protein
MTVWAHIYYKAVDKYGQKVLIMTGLILTARHALDRLVQ